MEGDATPDWALLADYLAGEATPAQIAQVEQWVGNDPERRAMVQELRKSWGLLARPEQLPFDLATIQDNVLSRIDVATPSVHLIRSEDVDRSGPRPTTARRVVGRRVPVGSRDRSHATGHPLLRWAGVAAVAAVAVLFVVKRPGANPADVAPATTYHTTNAQRANITLSDGSTVMLGDASTLTIESGFGHRTRAVRVDGEAYFTVAHRPGIPFTVRTVKTMTQVLGTTFLVREYATDSLSRVVVVDGKVSVSSGNRPQRNAAILTANGLAEVSDSGRITVTSDVTVNNYLDWTTGRLVFTNRPLREVIRDVERRYDLELHVPDALLDTGRLTGTLTNESTSEVLDLLAVNLQARYTRSGPNGRVVTFTATNHLIRRAPIRRSQTIQNREVQYGQ